MPFWLADCDCAEVYMAKMREILKSLIPDMQLSPALFWVGVAMSVDFALCLILMMFDSRQVTGVNVWLKPSKFAISSALTIFFSGLDCFEDIGLATDKEVGLALLRSFHGHRCGDH
jgi:hypothetical protein